jgi:phosphatidylglycerophosphatase A
VQRTDKAPPFVVRLLAGGFFTGYAPVASGTVGSALAVAIYWLIPGMDAWQVLLPVSLLSLVAGMPLATRMERHYGEDPSEVVLDEMAGMWIALLFVPKIWYLVLAAFLLFRFFDIVKPPPARQFDRMKGGFGIMMDDAAAGVYANLVVQIIRIAI